MLESNIFGTACLWRGNYSSLMDSHIHKQIHTVRYKSHISLGELLHVSATRSHPEGVSNAKGHKHQRFNLDSTVDVLNLFPEESTSVPKQVEAL